MDRKDLHRTQDKRKWLSTERGGFTIAPKLKIPDTQRVSHNTSFIEPYEDPELDPGFVRSEKAYLKQKQIKRAEREKKLLEQSAFSMAMDGSINNNTLFRELDKTSAMQSSGMSVNHDRTSRDRDNPLVSSTLNNKKTSASTARKKTYEPSNMGSTNRNSFYDTYQKI